MAALNQTYPTLLDLMNRVDPNGAPTKVVEMLTPRLALLQDMTFQEGNLPTGHRYTSRTALPSVGAGLAWRAMNEGVAPGKSQTAQIDETCGQLEGNSVVDCRLAALGGNELAFRATEDTAFVQAMSKEVENAMFYGSSKTNPDKPMGLSPRLDATTNVGGSQIIKHDATASGADQASIWLIGWSPETVFGITPKGNPGGLSPSDMGVQMWDDGTGKKFRAYVMNWNWQLGLCVKDWRYIARAVNVDTSNLVGTGSALIQTMISMTHMVQDLSGANFRFYVNRTIGRFLHLQALDSVKNSTLSIQEIGGKFITTFLGIPVRETDTLLNNESIVS